jgi:predicted MFS family arabinose efflux permease
MGIIGLLMVILFWMYFLEPQRGAGEKDTSSILSNGSVNIPKLSIGSFIASVKVPTVLILVIQAFPNTITWGIISVHLHDYLVNETGLSMQEGTLLIALFGAGAAFGGLAGGVIGTELNLRNKKYLPIFMGISTIIAAIIMKDILRINFRIDRENFAFTAGPAILICGALAAINGPNIRAILLNITILEARAAIIALSNMANAIGRGIGPSLAGVYMRYFNASRKEAVVMFLNLWIIAGVALISVALYIVTDEQRLANLLRKLVDDVL